MFQKLLKLLFGAFSSKTKPESTPKPETTEDPVSGEHEEYEGDDAKEPDLNTPKEHGLNVELVLKLGDSGPKVKSFQDKLEKLGYELTRHGADGHLGGETLEEVCDYQDDERDRGGTLKAEEHALKIKGVGPKTYVAIISEASGVVAPLPDDKDPDEDPSNKTPSNFFKLCPDSGKGVKAKRKRKWKDVKGITLHQTACDLGTKPSRYKKVSAHIGITQDGKIIQMNGLDWVVFHAQALSSKDIGVEINGYFAGIEGNLRTFWRPKSKPNRQPMSISDEQVEATLNSIEWIIKEVARNGGKVEYIHAHRQSSMSRTSDPGSKIWQKVAMVAKDRWGLKDGGPDFKLGGIPIPHDWDSSYTASYRG